MRPTLLVLEPSLTARMFLVDVLQEAGYDTLAADSLHAARKTVNGQLPVLAIVDSALLNEVGIGAVKDAISGMPIIASAHHASEPLPAGAAGRIVRPFSEEAVLECVRSVLAGAREKQATVLVIDDSATFRERLREAIEAAGYRVITADTGERGLAIANIEDLDAFVVDNVLPGIHGAAVVRRLRQGVRHRRTPSLLLTASEDPEQELIALEAGADAFVRKDESIEVVLARLAAILRSVGSPAIPELPGKPQRSPSVVFLQVQSPVAQESARWLAGEGVSVENATSINALQAEYDCIIAEIDEVHGAAELIRSIRAREGGRRARLLLLGHSEGSSEVVDAIAIGADDYLPYSAGAEVLTARVRSQLRRKQLEDENEQTRENLLRHHMELEAQKRIALARQALAEELRLARDIAEQKAREAADLLAQNEAVFSSIAEGLVISNLEGTLVYVNDSALRIYGASSRRELEELFNSRFEQCELKTLEGDTVAAEETPLAKALRGESHSAVELAFQRRDTGHSFLGSFNAVPVLTRDGKQILAAITVRDITLQKQSEAALRRTEKLAATGRLAASIAHEINNPLAAVTNLLYLLERTVADDPQAATFLAMAQKEVRRMAHITKQTLAFYRESTTPSAVDLCALSQEVAEVFATKLRSCGLDLRMELDCTERPLGFAGELRQVISNLVSNAIDASEGGGVIRLRIKPSFHNGTPGVRISIADAGRGIPREFYPEIFKPFSSSKGARGTGLGLWVTHSIVARHEGHISFYSSTRGGNSGTVFSVFIPITSSIKEDRQDSITALFREVGRELLAGPR